MGKPRKRKKVKRRQGRARSSEPTVEDDGSGGGSSGTMGGMRSGFKGLVGTGGGKKKESSLSKVLTYLLIAAALGVLLYRFVL